MIKVTIADPEIATLAGEWCNEHFGRDRWELWGQNLFTGNTRYQFGFHSERDATMFGLRWLEHA